MTKQPIGDLAVVNPRISTELTKDPTRPVSFVPMAQLSELGKLEPGETRPICEVQKAYTYFENGDVIVAKITPCMENGKAAFVENLPHKIGFGSTEFHVLRPSKSVLGKYLFYMVWNPFFRYEAEGSMTGSAGQKRVPTKFFERFQIPVPSLDEQRRIVETLDTIFIIRDSHIRATEITKDLLTSCVQQALEGSL